MHEAEHIFHLGHYLYANLAAERDTQLGNKLFKITMSIDNFYLEQFPINFTIQIGLGASQLDDLRILAPPVENTPFLARIKTWGYLITFYQSYQEKQEIFRQSCISVDSTPSLVHSCILEKDSELVTLQPHPTPTTTLFPETSTMTKAFTQTGISITTENATMITGTGTTERWDDDPVTTPIISSKTSIPSSDGLRNAGILIILSFLVVLNRI
ncbi:hypothetical protein Fcan01_11504 [Folsomia candida]|uniref:Uncharacterized protein n=1 Tax=Folsomia candida TaxID=158441 RepID=A0A226EB56_FOLCA|nr:hypothetical protein Fcan01_11504 [Folsomia candida]